jgi:cell division septal protein FtsQ
MKHKRQKKYHSGFFSGSGKFFLSLILLYLAFYLFHWLYQMSNERSDEYSRNQIEITGNRLVSSKTILNLCGFRSVSDEKVSIQIDSLAKQLMSIKYIKGISITRRPPRLLNITVEEYQPSAFIYGRGLNLIDEEGYLIPVPNRKIIWDLPLISGITERLGVLGQKTTASQAYLALEIVRYLEDENPLLYGLVSEINMKSDKFIELHLIRGGAIIRINKKSFYRELFVLNNYVASYLDWDQLSRIDYIDLRFKNQLVIKPRS